jgi:hypothetical protein
MDGGAAREIRTPDPIITNDVLYQLSYCGPVEKDCASGASRTALLNRPIPTVLAISVPRSGWKGGAMSPRSSAGGAAAAAE